MIADVVIASLPRIARSRRKSSAPSSHPSASTLGCEIEQLAAYATACRYPRTVGWIPAGPPGGELNWLIEKVDAVLGAAISRFGVELAKKGAPASQPEPIR